MDMGDIKDSNLISPENRSIGIVRIPSIGIFIPCVRVHGTQLWNELFREEGPQHVVSAFIWSNRCAFLSGPRIWKEVLFKPVEAHKVEKTMM